MRDCRITSQCYPTSGRAALSITAIMILVILGILAPSALLAFRAFQTPIVDLSADDPIQDIDEI